MSTTQVRPLEDRVLVKPLDAETKTTTGLFLPESAKEKPMQGKVVATVDQHADQLAVYGIEYALEMLKQKTKPADRETPIDILTIDSK